MESKKETLEDIINKIRNNPDSYPETNRMIKINKNKMDKQLKKQKLINRLPASEDETYSTIDEDEVNIPVENEPSDDGISEGLEQEWEDQYKELLSSGLDQEEARQILKSRFGFDKLEQEESKSKQLDQKQSEIFDQLSKAYQRLQMEKRIGQ